MRQIFHRREEPRPHFILGEAAEVAHEGRLVLGADRPQQEHAPIFELDIPLELARIRADRERSGGARRRQPDARIEPRAAIGTRNQRVDLELRDSRPIGHELRDARQH